MTTDNTTLQFLTNEADENEGMGHAGIETYKDAPYASVARECGQNSRDAGTSYPVKMKFDLIDIQQADFPGHSELQTAVSACLERAIDRDDEKEFDFFIRAEEILKSGNIKVLKIEDFNTTGLKGPSEPGTPFHSLVKSTGVSNKESDTSGGSFGIGKNATFAVSEIQSVYYATTYKDQGIDKFLAQGKSILVSHINSKGIPKRATGYWGCENYQPVDDPQQVPVWMRRHEVGTSVYALGFREAGNWDYRMAASLIQNFFCAIHRGEMEFLINNESIAINSNTLGSLFVDENIVNAVNESNRREDFDFSSNLYECLTSDDSFEKRFHIDGFGNASVRILVREDMPKRICIVRNGMAITDTLENFGDKFLNFPMYSEFVALVEPLDSEGSTLIKRVENPRHDGLSAERISDETKRKQATRIIKKFAKNIRKTIREQTLRKPEDEVALDELSEFFADTDQTDRLPDPNAEENPETFTYKPVTVRRKATTSSVDDSGEEGGATKTHDNDGKSGSSNGPGAGSGSGGSGQTGQKQYIEITGFRNIITEGNRCNRRLFFTPKEKSPALLIVRATGVNNSENISVQSVDGKPADTSGIRVNLEKDRTVIDVVFSEQYDGPIEIIAVKQLPGDASNEG